MSDETEKTNDDSTVTISRSTYEKFLEFQQVSGLLAYDIDFAWDLAMDRDGGEEVLKDLEENGSQDDPGKWFLWLLKDLKGKRDKAINDPKARVQRYQAMSMLFGLAARGQIVSTPMGGNDE